LIKTVFFISFFLEINCTYMGSFEEEAAVGAQTFEELGVIPELCLACKKLNYTVPSPIQAQAIPAALAGNDIIGLAQTGRYIITFLTAVAKLLHSLSQSSKPFGNPPQLPYSLASWPQPVSSRSKSPSLLKHSVRKSALSVRSLLEAWIW
jgi:hypothetical protein